MVITTQQCLARIRMLLRRVSDVKLPDSDIETTINRLLLGYVQDKDLARRDHATEITIVDFTELDVEGEFEISLAESVPDFEPQKLEYRLTGNAIASWYEVDIVPLASWARHFAQGRTIAAFYHANQNVRLSLEAQCVGQRQWQLTYREPLLAVVQGGTSPAIPAAHIPMLEMEAAVLCMPMVQDDSLGWVAWMERTLPIYEAQLGSADDPRPHTLRGRWRAYLNSSVEPQLQSIKPFNSFRHMRRRATRGYLPVQ